MTHGFAAQFAHILHVLLDFVFILLVGFWSGQFFEQELVIQQKDKYVPLIGVASIIVLTFLVALGLRW